jgi:hypothetical protein
MRTLILPQPFAFKGKDVFDFDAALSWFDWEIRNEDVAIDFTSCSNANYQALSLLVLYIWHLKTNRCVVRLLLSDDPRSASGMWRAMGAIGWSQVLYDEASFKGNKYKPLIALRNQKDFGLAIGRAEDYSRGFDVEYEKTLRYVISELQVFWPSRGSGVVPDLPKLKVTKLSILLALKYICERAGLLRVEDESDPPADRIALPCIGAARSPRPSRLESERIKTGNCGPSRWLVPVAVAPEMSKNCRASLPRPGTSLYPQHKVAVRLCVLLAFVQTGRDFFSLFALVNLALRQNSHREPTKELSPDLQLDHDLATSVPLLLRP